MEKRQLKMVLQEGYCLNAISTEAEIRRYTASDRERLKDVLKPLTVHRFSDGELDEVILKNPRVREDAVFTAWLDGRMVGTTTACLDQTTGMGEIHMVSVLSEAAGHHVGQALVEHAIEYLGGREELKRICLTTDDFRLPAVSIYLRTGFCPVVDDEEMVKRWQRVLSDVSVKHVKGYESLNSHAPTVELDADNSDGQIS